MALIQGTYQFAYRLINRDTNKYTKYSLISNPVSIYDKDDNNVGVSEVGDTLTSSITLTLNFTSKERTFYDYYQVAVIKNIVGSPVPDSKAYELAPRSITADSIDFIYTGNAEETSIDITEVNLITQAIDNVGTINSKLNRLVCGGINYKPLDYDNGDPVVGSTTDALIRKIGRGYVSSAPAEGAAYNDSANATNYTGYFRGELYRFAISYFDEFGNFSEPRVLDLSSAQNNGATTGVDYKFPSRKDYGFSILDSDSSVRAMGLNLQDIDNHPSWAKGFVILRATRKKDIIGQTPVVPSCIVEMPDANGDYPTADVDDPQTTGNPLGTLVPKNFEHGVVKSIVRDSDGKTLYGMAKSSSYPQIRASRHVVFTYIPDRLYNNNGTTLPVDSINKGDNLEFVDAVSLGKSRRTFTEGKDDSLEEGDYIDTSVSTTYHGLIDDQYYYNNVNANQADLDTISGLVSSIKIREAKDISNNQSVQALATFARSLKTSTVGDYEGIKDSLGLGYTPSNLKSTVLVLEDEFVDYMYKFMTASWSDSDSIANNGANTQFQSGALSLDSDTIPNTGTFDEAGFQTNDYAYPNSTANERGVVAIANITKGLGDNRYGDQSEANSFISTGSVHYFSDAQIALNEAGTTNPIDIDVWGGDCFISVFNVKLTDRTYSLMQSLDQTATELRWNTGSYKDNGSALNVTRPIAVKNNAQILSVYLESEINGAAVSREVYGETTIGDGVDAVSEKEASSPIDYQYNLSFSMQNSIRVWEADNKITEDINEFRSRIIYSDTKIYQSDVEGFDIFRVLNFKDIDETYGAIKKLARAGDDMYSIQERAISYIPVSSRILETSDLDTLSVRTDEFIGEPYYLSNTQGTSLIDSIKQTKSSIYLVDDYNKEVVSISNKKINNITEFGLHSFVKEIDLQNGRVYSVFNESDDEYIFYNNESQKGAVFSERLNKWISKVELSSDDFIGSMNYLNNSVYALGYGLNGLASSGKIYKLYSGDFSKFLEAPYESSIEFAVNDEEGLTKVYDNTLINASDNLSTIKYTTRAGFTDEISIDIPSKEDVYRVKILRGQSGERIRGVFSDVLVKFKPSLSSIYSVGTKVRPSYRFKR